MSNKGSALETDQAPAPASKDKRRHGLKIFLGVVVVVLAAAAVAAYTQRDFIKAYITARSKTQEEVQVLKEEADAEVDDALGKLGVDVEPISPQDEEAVRSGALTEEELRDILFDQTPGDEEGNSGVSDSGQPAAQDTDSSRPETETQTSIEDLIAHIYYLREVYSGRLDDLFDQAVEKYKALPPEERTADEKMKIALSLNGQARALERACDAEIETTLAQMEDLLESTGEDLSVINEIRGAYESQKEAARAYYMSLLV